VVVDVVVDVDVVVVVLLVVVTGATTTVLDVVDDVVVVVVGTPVVGSPAHAEHMPPAPPETPPPAVHVAASRVMRMRVRVQSSSVSHAIHGLLLHEPAAVPSPGVGSLQVPALVAQQTTAPGRPHVDRAAQRIMRSAVPIRQPAFRNVLP